MAYAELEGIESDEEEASVYEDEEDEDLDAEATTNASNSPYVEGGVSAAVEATVQTPSTSKQTIVPKTNPANLHFTTPIFQIQSQTGSCSFGSY